MRTSVPARFLRNRRVKRTNKYSMHLKRLKRSARSRWEANRYNGLNYLKPGTPGPSHFNKSVVRKGDEDNSEICSDGGQCNRRELAPIRASHEKQMLIANVCIFGRVTTKPAIERKHG